MVLGAFGFPLHTGIDMLNPASHLGKPIINPDIKDIKEPEKVYDILIEAIAIGKLTKWK